MTANGSNIRNRPIHLDWRQIADAVAEAYEVRLELCAHAALLAAGPSHDLTTVWDTHSVLKS